MPTNQHPGGQFNGVEIRMLIFFFFLVASLVVFTPTQGNETDDLSDRL